jgi:regulator of protease activity HflC (stomatin/prohibitin superfamily)
MTTDRANAPEARSNHATILAGGGVASIVGAALLGATAIRLDSFLAGVLAVELTLVSVSVWLVLWFDTHRRRNRLATLHLLAGCASIAVLFALGVVGLNALARPLPERADTPLGGTLLAAAFIWMVLARTFDTLGRSDLAEGRSLGQAFREAQWAAFLGSAALFVRASLPEFPRAVAWCVLAWTAACAGESLIRSVLAQLMPDRGQPLAPTASLLRELLFRRGQPLASVVRTVEDRLGVDLRGSFAAEFVRRSLPILGLALLVVTWAMTAVVVVPLDEMGAREDFGRAHAEPLPPGLYWKLPWPFSQVRLVAVRRIRSFPIGFVETAEPRNRDLLQPTPRSLLWTRPHAAKEYNLVLGSGSELVAINALVYWKVAEDPQGFHDYVYGHQDVETTLTALADRVLMHETRSDCLEDVLARNRAEFAHRLTDQLQRLVAEERLGVEVVELALLNLHPPIEVAGDFLDVISAHQDAARAVVEAEGSRRAALLESKARSDHLVAAARADAQRRIGEARAEATVFHHLAAAFASQSARLRERLWIGALETALRDQRLFLVDPKLFSDGDGTLWLDTRPHHHSSSPPTKDGSP